MKKNSTTSQSKAESDNRNMLKNIMTLIVGAGAAKIIGVLAIPVITRIYNPESLGVLALFLAVSAILVPFGSLGYSIALPLPRHDGLAINLAVVSVFFLCVFSFLFIVCLTFLGESLLNLLSLSSLISYKWLLAITVFVIGLFNVLNFWATRERAFKALVKAKVVQSLFEAIVKIFLGLVGVMSLGLIFGHVIAQFIGVVVLGRIFLNKLKIHRRKITKSRVLFLVKYYKDYPKFRLPSQVLMVFSMQAPLLFANWLFGVEAAGQLGLALMVLALPIALFGSTIGQAYYAEIAQLGRKKPKEIYNITKSITIKLFLLGISPTLVLFLYGSELFQFAFGRQWGDAGSFSSALAVYLLMQFVSAPIVNALSVFNKQGAFLKINIRRVIFIISIFCFSFLAELNLVQTLNIFSLLLAIHYLLVTRYVFKVIRYQINESY